MPARARSIVCYFQKIFPSAIEDGKFLMEQDKIRKQIKYKDVRLLEKRALEILGIQQGTSFQDSLRGIQRGVALYSKPLLTPVEIKEATERADRYLREFRPDITKGNIMISARLYVDWAEAFFRWEEARMKK